MVIVLFVVKLLVRSSVLLLMEIFFVNVFVVDNVSVFLLVFVKLFVLERMFVSVIFVGILDLFVVCRVMLLLVGSVIGCVVF